MRQRAIIDRTDEDGAMLPASSEREVRESLARAEADVVAGRVVEGEIVLTELRAMIDAYRAGRRDGAVG